MLLIIIFTLGKEKTMMKVKIPSLTFIFLVNLMIPCRHVEINVETMLILSTVVYLNPIRTGLLGALNDWGDSPPTTSINSDWVHGYRKSDETDHNECTPCKEPVDIKNLLNYLTHAVMTLSNLPKSPKLVNFGQILKTQ